MKWINAEEVIHTQIYDDEHEEWPEREMTIEEFLDAFTDEGCPTVVTPPEDTCSECNAWNKYKNYPQKTQWIPCSDRLPSEGENVLLCDTLFGNVAIGKLIKYNTSCCWEVDHWDCDIEDWQAWMPLPEPWKGEQL